MLRLNVAPLVKGGLTFIPGMARLLPETVGAPASAEYCYGVWLKHLVLLRQNGLREMPRTVAELGPGNSLGTGFAALLSGAERYLALDVVAHATTERNLKVFDELVDLFHRRAPRPRRGWPDYDRHLDRNLFPGHILTEDLLRVTLAPARIARIRDAIAGLDQGGNGTIAYMVPWSDENVIKPDSVDLIVSHAVLGQVDDLPATYRALTRWLKPGGVMSHQIGFEFASFTGAWNGYWACPAPLWKIIRGRRDYGINRLPGSTHLDLLAEQGTRIVCALRNFRHDGTPRSHLAAPWRGLSDDDLYCSELFVQATK